MKTGVIRTQIESNSTGKRESATLFVILFKIGSLLAFLNSLNAWFFWNFDNISFSTFCAVLCAPLFLFSKRYFLITARKICILILLVLARLYCTGDNNVSLSTYFAAIMTIMPVSFFLLLKASFQKTFLVFFTNSMAIILAPSLLIWIALLIGVPLPSLGEISNPAWDFYVYNNYFFCLRNLLLYDIRFCSIFLEPGHLGMICVFLLFVNKFDFKSRSVQVIFIACLFTLSLAAYVLLLLSFSVKIAIFSKKKFEYFISWFLILLLGYVFFTNYNGGDNIINDLIISRLEYDSDEGDIAGNNRVSIDMDSFYDKFVKSDNLWFGVGKTKFKNLEFGAAAGYKVFVVTFGLIGLLLVFMFYFSFVLAYWSPFSLGILLIYSVSFLQRSYPFWDSLIYIYALGILVDRSGRLKMSHLFKRRKTDDRRSSLKLTQQ